MEIQTKLLLQTTTKQNTNNINYNLLGIGLSI